MAKKLYRLFADFVSERTTEIANDIAVSNKTYKELTQKVKNTYGDVKNNLPLDCQKHLDSYEDAVQERESAVFEALYKQGLVDGIQISKIYSKLLSVDSTQVEKFLKRHWEDVLNSLQEKPF